MSAIIGTANKSAGLWGPDAYGVSMHGFASGN